jgi:hypothetical protein
VINVTDVSFPPHRLIHETTKVFILPFQLCLSLSALCSGWRTMVLD